MTTAGLSAENPPSQKPGHVSIELLDNKKFTLAGRLLCAALALLLPYAVCANAVQTTPRGTQSVPQPVEEESHHGSVVKESRVVLSSRLKAPQHRPLVLARSDARAAFRPTRELRSDLAERWDAHSDRRRGPPASLLS